MNTAPATARGPSSFEVGGELPRRTIHMSLEKSRLFTLPAENFHTHDEIARRLGLRVAVPPALMSYGYLSKFCTDLFGDTWTKSGTLEVTFVKMLQRDDILTVRGRIIANAPEEHGARLTLEIGIENSRGETVAAGTATGLVV